MFSDAERTFAETDDGELKIYAFRYSTGVEAVRICNRRGEIIVLPFQGQQIWRCSFDEKELTMKSMFTEPRPTRNYLSTYGGFLLHCGATAMGVPGPEDDHPLHGELPNAPYESAYLEIGSENAAAYAAIGGRYEYLVAFNYHYTAEPRIVLTEGSAFIDTSMRLTNLRSAEMEYMYMMHINFRPVDNGELVYSADIDPSTVRPFVSIPSHMKVSAGVEKLKRFLGELESNPEKHHVLDPNLPFDPEIVFSITYKADEDGWAHSMMVYPGDDAAYIAHKPDELPFGIRWIARTADEDALGLTLPATAEHKGYTAEKEKNNLRILSGGESVEFHTRAGHLQSGEVPQMKRKIEDIRRSN